RRIVAVGRRRHERRRGEHGFDRLALRWPEVALERAAGVAGRRAGGLLLRWCAAVAAGQRERGGDHGGDEWTKRLSHLRSPFPGFCWMVAACIVPPDADLTWVKRVLDRFHAGPPLDLDQCRHGGRGRALPHPATGTHHVPSCPFAILAGRGA